MKKKFSTKYFLILIIIIFIILITFSVFYFKKMDSIFDSIKEKQKTISSFEDENDLLLTKKSLIDNQEDVNKIMSYLVTKDNVVSYVENIENIGNLYNLDINIDKIDLKDGFGKKIVKDKNGNTKIGEVKTHSLIEVTLNTEGSWQEIMSFVSTLEHFTKYTVVKDIRVSSSFNEGKIKWSLNIVVQALTT